MHIVNNKAPWPEEPGNTLVVRILEFVRFVRENDFQIGIQEELDALTVAKHCDITDRQRLHWGLRSLLCSNNNEWKRFDQLFNLYWLQHVKHTNYVSGSSPGGKLSVDAASQNAVDNHAIKGADRTRQDEEGDESIGQGGTRSGASQRETHLQTDFRFLTDNQQMHLMEQMVERLARRMRRRLIRRYRNLHRGRRLDFRRTIRNSLSHGGTPLELAFKQKQRRLPKLVLLLDVSRSMSFYSYFFLRFARGIVGAFKDADAFIFHTHLVQVTDALREHNINIVTKRLAVLSAGWAGGTRIGECFQTFNRDYARRVLTSKSIVMIFSDGLDTGTPELFSEQLALIKRRAKKIVWLNPLMGRSGYQPTAQCMQAALPMLDLFAPAHNLQSLLALESQLVKL
ncbi:MAG: VWA domain-containing protein [Gammaproteobacteria bacterium]|nr:VWA domain-containing protein [Gammaproteobacteria bacterium]